MTRSVLAVLIVTLASLGTARADGAPFQQAGKLGLGLGGSNYASGLSGKYYLSDQLAAQASIGYWYAQGASVSVDGIKEMPALFDSKDLGVNWNFGAGASASFWGGVGLGVQGVAGLRFWLNQFPLEATIELRPTVWILGGYWDVAGRLWVSGGGALRYFF